MCWTWYIEKNEELKRHSLCFYVHGCPTTILKYLEYLTSTFELQSSCSITNRLKKTEDKRTALVIRILVRIDGLIGVDIKCLWLKKR